LKTTRGFGYYGLIFLHFPSVPTDNLQAALTEAATLEATGNRDAATRILDNALLKEPDGSPSLRFRALVLRADLAVSLNDLIEARGILAEAGQVPLSPADRESLAADLRRFDDLEVFLTHRGCAG
jgi:hypothetical protein